MQIRDDRYFQERLRHDLALRMIRYEARTCTIRSCTGLTDARIRRLYRTFATHQPSTPLRRRRGKSPRQLSFFTRNTRAQFESSLLASQFAIFGLLEEPSQKRDPLELGRLFCDAYEIHRQLLGHGQISFEHAWFLLQVLRRGGLSSTRCRHCDSSYLHDRSDPRRRSCPGCKLKQSRRRKRG